MIRWWVYLLWDSPDRTKMCFELVSNSIKFDRKDKWDDDIKRFLISSGHCMGKNWNFLWPESRFQMEISVNLTAEEDAGRTLFKWKHLSPNFSSFSIFTPGLNSRCAVLFLEVINNEMKKFVKSSGFIVNIHVQEVQNNFLLLLLFTSLFVCSNKVCWTRLNEAPNYCTKFTKKN